MRFLMILAYVLATLTTSAFFAPDARAVNLSWDAAGGGDADKASNWTPSQIPSLADDLTFGISNAYTVDWSNSISNVDTIDVSAGNVIFEDLGSTDLTTTGLLEVGDNSGGMATLALDGGTWTAGSSVRIGFQAADDGRIEVLDDAIFNTPTIAVGFRGDGELILTEGAIIATGNLNAASATSGSTNGTALIEVGDTFNVTGTTNLGASAGGTATLRVNGGKYTSGGATTINAGSLLEVLSGSYDADNSLTLASATSTLTVNGGELNANAGLNNSAAGNFNLLDGTLTVTGGAFQPNAGGVSDDYTIEGPTAVEMPHLVLGTGATATIADELKIGDTNQGTLTVNNGATVSNSLGTIGFASGSTGAVTVDGTGSTWTNSFNLLVGVAGTGTLDIQNGGTVTNTTGVVGVSNGSMGTATVDGAGSAWTISNDLLVGNSGSGILNIENGGAVSNVSGTIGSSSGSTGTATIDGVGSTWTNSGELTVGDLGNGTLTIQNGATVSNSLASIGSMSGSTGAVTVDGTGSTWTNSFNLLVGVAGTGTLDIQNGGTVTNTTGVVGVSNGSMGTATVDGAGSAWTISNDLLVGNSGSGILNIENGGAVSNVSGTIGSSSGSTGTATIDGVGSTWQNTSGLYIGGSDTAAGGTGSLNVQNNGLVEVDGELKVWEAGTVNLLGGTLDVTTLDLTEIGSTFNMTGGRLVVENVDGDLTNQGGTLAPGQLSGTPSPGTTTINGDYDQQSGALEVELGGLIAGTEFDMLDISGDVSLAGTLNVSLFGGFTLGIGDAFEFINIDGTRSGTFAGLTEGALVGSFGGTDLFISYTAGDGNDVSAHHREPTRRLQRRWHRRCRRLHRLA